MDINLLPTLFLGSSLTTTDKPLQKFRASDSSVFACAARSGGSFAAVKVTMTLDGALLKYSVQESEGDPISAGVYHMVSDRLVALRKHDTKQVQHAPRPGASIRRRADASPQGRALQIEARRELANILSDDGLAPLAALRLSKGLSQAQLAEKTGMLQPQISRIENGQHEVTLGSLARLAEALEVDVGVVAEAASRGVRAKDSPSSDD